MVQKRTCDYTGEDIEPGTGTMFVRTDGSILWFKDSKAKKNYMMGREARDLEWIGYEEAEETEAEEEPPADTEEADADADDVEADAEEPEADADEADADADEADADSEDVEADDGVDEEDADEEETEAQA